MAINKLNCLFQYTSSESLKPKLIKLCEDYLTTCMEYLEDTVEIIHESKLILKR
jgi:hypothetical protein